MVALIKDGITRVANGLAEQPSLRLLCGLAALREILPL
jgi:hypothetical protein